MKKICLLLWLVICLQPLRAARIDTLKVASQSMQKEIKVLAIVPDAETSNPCPVVYLLHGYDGDAKTWISIKPELPKIADEKKMLFICPDGENSWYWDSPLNPDVKYETFISSELVEYVDSHYHTIAGREGRAITGLSMGGHGAMWNAIRHADVFGAAGSMSGGVDIRPFPKSWEMSLQLGDEETHRDNWESHTVINLVPGMKPGTLALIFDCGETDFFHEVNVNFHEALLKQGIEHDFITRPGDHDAKYWANAIDYHLLFFQKYFQRYLK